jgi:hypothetical protein
MKRIRTTFSIGVLEIAASVGTSAHAQPATDMKYKITWKDPKDAALGRVYAVMRGDRQTL